MQPIPALLVILLSLRPISPARWNRSLLRWRLIAAGSALLFLLLGMVSFALDVFFAISAALLVRKDLAVVEDRQKFLTPF